MDRARLVVIAAAVVTALASLAAFGAAVTSSDDDDSSVSTGVTPPTGSPATAAAAIEIRDFSFNPADLTVAAGTEVVWTNADGLAHSVVAEDGSFGSEDLSEGASFPFTFTGPGVYPYVCGIHDSMHGTITVEG